MLRALGHAHTIGLVHRDIKPSNVMLKEDGPRMEAVLVDFGLAVEASREVTWGLTRTGDFRGTPDFMAPECLFDARQHSVRGDLFGVGATLYFALTGRTCRQPLGRDDVTFEALARSEIVPLQEARPLVDPRLAEVVDRALAVQPLRPLELGGGHEVRAAERDVGEPAASRRPRAAAHAAGAGDDAADALIRVPRHV